MSKLSLVILGICVLLALAACGKKGDVKPPEGYAKTTSSVSER